MSLYSECVGQMRSLHAGDLTGIEGETPKPESDRGKVERFAIQGELLALVAPDILVIEDGEAKFKEPLSEDVNSPVTLAAWTAQRFRSTIMARYEEGEDDVVAMVDRLAEINIPLLDVSLKMAGIEPTDKIRESVAGSVAARSLSSLQVENYALELDKHMRLLNLFSRIYNLEMPTGPTAREAMIASQQDHFLLARQQIQVQDFFDALGTYALLMDNGRLPSPTAFEASVEATNIYWTYRHREHIKDARYIPGTKPKAFYKIRENGGVIQSATPMVDKVSKKIDEDEMERRIGCAGILKKAEGMPKSVLAHGLEATINAFDEINYFDRSSDDYIGTDPQLLQLVEVNGEQHFLGQSVLDCTQSLARLV